MAQAQLHADVSHVETAAEPKPKRQVRWFQVIVYVFIAIFTITSVGPFIFAFVSSFKTEAHILDFPPSLIPNPFVIDNYKNIVTTLNGAFLRWVLNSIIYAVAAAALNILFSAMAGYALSRLRFRGRNIIFVLTLAVMMIPMPATIIPKFLIINSVHLTNTYIALLLPAMAQPFSVFLMVQFMKGLPRELEESATIDGASRWTIFTQIITPLVKPALTAVGILSFQGAWNDFIWPLLVMNSQDMYTLPLGLFYYKSAHYTQYNLLIAGSMFNTIPMIILFFIFQRYFIEGVTSSAVKG